jgi:hypothetical protein
VVAALTDRDVLARVVRAGEAFEDGELELARQILADLEADLVGTKP